MMKETTKQELIQIKDEILNNWKARNGYLGIKRATFKLLSSVRMWKMKKVIALMRKQKIIALNKRNYFVLDEKRRLLRGLS